MENSNLREQVLMEIEDLITQSCPKQKADHKFEALHVALIKKHYNATDVLIDYHRKRAAMDIVMDDQDYNPKTINLHVPTLHVNLGYRNLCDFLKSCIVQDAKSIAFYAGLASSYKENNKQLMTA